MSSEEGRQDLMLFKSNINSSISIHNTIESQVIELYKINNPSRKFSEKELSSYWENWSVENEQENYGTWVYFPWKNSLVHLLPENDFIRLRTARNQYKISPEEQRVLKTKTIGLIGLSVGQSVALTLAMERAFGTLRIADFDHLELSNLNRIRSSLTNLGLPKTTIVAREIAEIDPFLKIEVFGNGITDENLLDFIGLGPSKLDLLIEECDSLDIKIKARLAARSAQVPVIMDTSDRGMMDIERFDQEPDRAIMHGMVKEEQAANLASWTAKERLTLVMEMVGVENISSRLKASLLEVESSLTTWPQLASSVTLGGAISTVVARKILLNFPVKSGRFYLDVDQHYLTDSSEEEPLEAYRNIPRPLSFDYCQNQLESRPIPKEMDYLLLEETEIQDLVHHACLAPSGGNIQPWKWVWDGKRLALFHDKHQSHSFLDYKHRGSLIALGAAIENVEQRALYLGYQAEATSLASNFNDDLIAIFYFKRFHHGKSPRPLQIYGERLDFRLTNRLKSLKKIELPAKLKQEVAVALEGSTFQLTWVEDSQKMKQLAQIVGEIERLRILDPWGHDDFIKEARWTKKEAETTKTGVDLRTLNLTEADLVGFKLIKDQKAISSLRQWDKGKGLVKMSSDSLKLSSAFVLLHTQDHDAAAVIKGGKWVERLWLHFNGNGIAYQPISPATFMFARLGEENPSTSAYLKSKLIHLRRTYLNLLDLDDKVNDLFLCRLFYAEEPEVKSLRRPLADVYKRIN